MNIVRISGSLLLAVLGATAQAQCEKTQEQVSADLAAASCAGAIAANHDSTFKVNEELTQRCLKGPQRTAKQAPRSSRIVTFDPILSFGQ